MIFQNFVRAFLKAAGHRYYKRVPYMTPKGKRYRYFYRVTSTHRGRHAFDAEHLVEGTKFALHGEGESEFHGHITKVDGDQVTYVIDDGPRKGEEVTTSRKELVAELNEVHGVQDKLTAEREKVRAAIAEAKRAGHEGVVRRLERRLRALGGEPEAQPTEPEAESVEPEAESVEPEAESETTRSRFRELLADRNLNPDAKAFSASEFAAYRALKRGAELKPNQKKALKKLASGLFGDGIRQLFDKISINRGASYTDSYSRNRKTKYYRLKDFADHAGIYFSPYSESVARANRSTEYAMGTENPANEARAIAYIIENLELTKESTRGDVDDQIAAMLADYQDSIDSRIEEARLQTARSWIASRERLRASEDENPLTSTEQLEQLTEEIADLAQRLPEDERKEIEERSKQFFEQRERKAQERAERRERERQERLEQQERERQEARARRLEEAEGDRFLETVTPEQAREDYHDAQVKGDLEALRNRRNELEGVDPVAITKSVKEPIPTDGTERVYTLPDGGRLAAHIDGDTLVYQYQFPAGTVSNKQEAKLNTKRKMTDARLRKLAQGLAAAYYGGDGAYYTPETEEAIEDHRADIADVARLNKAERAFSTFDERTRETRVQQDALDPITPRSDAINSAEDIDKKTLAALKRTRSTDKIRTNMTQAGRAGDLLFATDGRRLFYRRGMNYGTDNKVVAIDNKATPEQLDERPPGADVLVDRVEGNTQHAGTMSKETAKHLADALEIAKGTGADSALFVRADGEKVAIIYKGRELASFPQAEGSESRGDYGVSADYFRDALLDGGSVSLYLHPENPRVDVEPMRLESMAGAHIIMPQRF